MPVLILTATIAPGQFLSGAVDCSAGRITQINTPGAWDPANITFQISPNGVAYQDLYVASGEELMLTCRPSRGIVVRPDNWPAARFMKLRSGSSANPVVQTGSRVFEIIVDTSL